MWTSHKQHLATTAWKRCRFVLQRPASFSLQLNSSKRLLHATRTASSFSSSWGGTSGTNNIGSNNHAVDALSLQDPQSFYTASQKQVMQKTKALHASIMPLNEKVRESFVVCRIVKQAISHVAGIDWLLCILYSHKFIFNDTTTTLSICCNRSTHSFEVH